MVYWYIQGRYIDKNYIENVLDGRQTLGISASFNIHENDIMITEFLDLPKLDLFFPWVVNSAN